MSKRPPKYPPYPSSNYDYSLKESARMALRKPHRSICIYCHGQGMSDETVAHVADCPARKEADAKGES